MTAKIMLYTHLNTKETEVQACIDVGQGLLKVMMSVKEKQIEESDKERQKYEDGYDPKEFKLSSVKKVFILAVTKTVENHQNMSTLLENLGLEAIEFGYSVDLKMMLILCGKQNASCKKLCAWCDGFAP